jgi:gluconolactonase
MPVSSDKSLLRFALIFGSVLGAPLLNSCGSAGEEADGVPNFTYMPGAGGGASVAQAAGQGGRIGSAGVGPRTSEGAGGNISASLGRAGNASMLGQNVGGSQNLAGSGNALGGTGSGGAQNLPAAGRVGAELCPAGPFGDPVPANAAVTQLGSVGENNYFLWEGVVWTGDALYFSEIANGNASQINRYTAQGGVQRGAILDTGSNGLALDAAGDLLLAAHDVGGISRVDLPGGTITRGAQQNAGQRFNSPNDLVLRGDGNVYFTDPDFQSPAGRIQGGTRVYRIAPPNATGAISVVDATLDQPNGITLSPDGNTLYVNGSGILRAYDLDAAGVASPAFDFPMRLEVGDGMGVDCAGNIYAVENGARRIRVFSPGGDLLATIGPAGFTHDLTNVAFGGPNRTTLFVSSASQGAQGGLFSVELNIPGLPY